MEGSHEKWHPDSNMFCDFRIKVFNLSFKIFRTFVICLLNLFGNFPHRIFLLFLRPHCGPPALYSVLICSALFLVIPTHLVMCTTTNAYYFPIMSSVSAVSIPSSFICPSYFCEPRTSSSLLLLPFIFTFLRGESVHSLLCFLDSPSNPMRVITSSVFTADDGWILFVHARFRSQLYTVCYPFFFHSFIPSSNSSSRVS